jgi:hypothetical protein
MVRGRQKASKKETGPLPWRATPASEGKQVLAWAGRGAVPLSGRPPPAAGRPLRDVRLLARSPPLEAGWVKAGITVLRGVLAKGGFCLGRVACFVCMHGPVCLSVCHYPEWGTVRGAPGARNACITAARSCGRFFRIEVRDGASSGVFWAWAWAASGARGHIHKIAAGVARSWRRQRCCAALRGVARGGLTAALSSRVRPWDCGARRLQGGSSHALRKGRVRAPSRRKAAPGCVCRGRGARGLRGGRLLGGGAGAHE